MKKKFNFTVIFLFIVSVLNSQGLDQLAHKVSSGIFDFFQNKYNVRTAIIKYENLSGQSDLIAHKFYQLMVSKLESNQAIDFADLLINFSENRGQFNLNTVNKLNYWIYVKLVQNKSKLGAGFVIFSKSLDRIVSVKYVETFLDKGEKDILNTTNFGFKSLGFFKEIEIEANKHLLDLKSVSNQNGEFRYYFYYPEKVIVYRMMANQLQKDSTIQLKWGRPFYPVLEYVGRLLIFQIGDTHYLTVGNNFSPKSIVFANQNGQWQEIGRLDLVPIKFIELNNVRYLAGSRFEAGKNHFQNKILLLPFSSGRFDTSQIFEKQIPTFYSLDFSTKDNQLMSVHIVDRDYYYRFFAADFEEWTVEKVKRGASLSILDNQWLAVSDYTTLADKIYFYQVKNGGRRLVYEAEIPEEVLFISSGVWKSNKGFWFFLKKILKYGEDYSLQFWRKSSDPESQPENENNQESES